MATLKDQAIIELLILQVQGGDMTAFKHLYVRLNPRLVLASLRMVGEKSAAEDIVQEAWIKLSALLPKVKVASEFIGNAYRLVRWRSLDHLRRNKRHVALDEDQSIDPEGVKDNEIGDVLDVQKAMAKLDPDQRLILHLFYYEGYSVPEIARLLAIKIGTVKSRLFRSRQSLKDQLTTSQNPLKGD